MLSHLTRSGKNQLNDLCGVLAVWFVTLLRHLSYVLTLDNNRI
jgi:hypothetical protein